MCTYFIACVFFDVLHWSILYILYRYLTSSQYLTMRWDTIFLNGLHYEEDTVNNNIAEQ